VPAPLLTQASNNDSNRSAGRSTSLPPIYDKETLHGLLGNLTRALAELNVDAATEPESEAGSSARQPSREQTMAALKQVEQPVKQCAKGQGGTAVILVKVAGKTGAVQSVSVDGVEGAVGLCIAREVYRAKFPTFSQPVFTVRYPLVL